MLILTENDIPSASLLGRKPEELKISELKLWLKCCGDSGKELKIKAKQVKRFHEFIRTGRDKEIVDPDRIYSRRNEKQNTSTDLANESD